MILIGDDLLQVISGTASTIDVHVGVIDDDGNFYRQNTAVTGAETKTVLELAGSSSNARKVEDLIVHNKDTHGSAVSIRILNGTTATVVWSGTLDAGQRTVWGDDLGFVSSAAPKLDLMRYVTADSVHATAATFATITGLTPFPVVAGHVYAFEAQFFHVADATTTGAQFAIGGATATYVIIGSQDVVTAGVATTTMCSNVATAVDTAAIVETTSSTAATVPGYVAGTIIPSATGDLSFKATSEVTVAAGLTVKKGSWAWMRETDN